MSRLPALALVLIALTGCREMSLNSGGLGVTAGGSQDIGLVRDIVERGGIPGDDSLFVVEGLFAEHDLPLDGPQCASALCPIAGTVAIDPLDGSGAATLVQLGFSSKFAVGSFEREPQSLVLVVDESGSMETDAKLEAVKTALRGLVEHLDEHDEVALVGFDDTSRVNLRMRSMSEAGKLDLLDEIDDLRLRGGTNIEAGLEDGYRLFGSAEEANQHRLMLFTDAQPNVGATDAGSFLDLVRDGADDGIGISVFGVGLDMGPELAREISEVRGGNSYYLRTEQLATLFDELDFMVTPVAFDLDVQVAPAAGLEVAQVYGAPVDDEGAVAFGASTLFLSSQDGGMGLSVRRTDALAIEADAAVAEFTVTYESVDGEPVEQVIQVTHDAEPQVGPARMAVLVDEFAVLGSAVDFCGGTVLADDLLGQIAAVRARLDGDPELAQEVDLLDKLAANVVAGGECMSY